MQQVDDDATFRKADTVFVQDIGDELILLDMAREVYFGLDEVGATLFGLLDEGHTLAEAVDAVAERYGAESEVVRADTMDLVIDLVGNGLILPMNN